MRRPRQRGSEILMDTRTLMKLPPSQTGGSFGCCIIPNVSQICSATSLFLYLSGISYIWTQKETLLKLHSSNDDSKLIFDRAIRCLSKHHGSDASILSTSASLSKEKRMIRSPIFLMLKPFFDLHRGEKVLAIASIFKVRLVKNLAAMENSSTACSFFNLRPDPSLSERERELQCFVSSSYRFWCIDVTFANVMVRMRIIIY